MLLQRDNGFTALLHAVCGCHGDPKTVKQGGMHPSYVAVHAVVAAVAIAAPAASIAALYIKHLRAS